MIRHFIWVCAISFLPCMGAWKDTGHGMKPPKGRPAEIGEFPFMASLQNTNEEGNFEHYCGGSIANRFYIFTACHCVAKPPVIGDNILLFENSNRMVVVGTVNNELTQGSGTQTRLIEEAIPHPNCKVLRKGVGWNWDYAFIRVELPFVFGSLVRPFPIFSEDRRDFETDLKKMIKEGAACEVVGWGVQRDYDTGLIVRTSSKLLVVTVYLMKYRECFKALCDYDPRYCGINHLARRQICAHSSEGEDVCQGDSGGPVICDGHVFAILSWGPTCGGETALPSMYSTIDGAWDFIVTHIGQRDGRIGRFIVAENELRRPVLIETLRFYERFRFDNNSKGRGRSIITPVIGRPRAFTRFSLPFVAGIEETYSHRKAPKRTNVGMRVRKRKNRLLWVQRAFVLRFMKALIHNNDNST